MKKLIYTVVAIVVVASIVFIGIKIGASPSTEPLDEQSIQKLLNTIGATPMHATLPNLTIKTLEGDDTISLQDYAGKVLLLPIWVSWCPACQSDMIHMAKFAEKFSSNKDLAIVSISRDENIEDARNFVQDNEITFPVLHDPEGVQHDSTTALQVKGTPTAFIIDPNGTIIGKAEGYHEWDNPAVVAAMKTLVKGLMIQ